MHQNYKPSQDEYDYILSKILSEIENPNPIYNNQQALWYVKPKFLSNWDLDIVRIAKDTRYKNYIFFIVNTVDKYTGNDSDYNVVFMYNLDAQNMRILVWPRTCIRLSIFSKEIETYQELQSYTKLKTSNERSKWDKRKHGNTYHEDSHISIDFENANLPWTFENNINNMFDYIETDSDWILSLSKKSKIYLNVSSKQHFAYTWWPSLTSEMIAKLYKYNIEFDYDFGIYWLPENIFIS